MRILYPILSVSLTFFGQVRVFQVTIAPLPSAPTRDDRTMGTIKQMMGDGCGPVDGYFVL
jgi:hypothetical protein